MSQEPFWILPIEMWALKRAVACLALCVTAVWCQSIAPLLQRLEMGHLSHDFDAAGVTAKNARHLQSQDLRELGVRSVRERLLLLAELEKMTPPIVDPSDLPNSAHQDFVFKVANYWTSRQMGKLMNFIVKFRYPPGANATDWIEYNAMRDTVLYYAEPTSDIPMRAYWEQVNNAIVANLTSRFAVLGMSSQIQVQGESVRMYEPGDHGSIVTVGRIEPLNIPAIFNNTPV